MRTARAGVLALVVVFALRLAIGLSADLYTEDETQIFLLGLRYHATHAWPHFGPDVVWTKSQIPGALQALLVGLPLAVAPIPEAPYVLLNLLSMGALCLFASYLCARLPASPRWLIWGWLLTVPWTLNFSTHIMNPDYVLPASLIFFIGFFEAWPPLSIGRVRMPLAHAMQGAAIGWIAQIHMSWPLLLPFAGLALLARLREGARATAVASGAFALGGLVTGSVLLPTLMTLGPMLGAGNTEQNLHLHWREPISTFVKTAARVLSFASLETNRFVADGTNRQVLLLWDHLWVAPMAIFVSVVGIVHPLWMALTAFRRESARPDWPAVRWLTVGTVAFVSSAFFFVMEPAQARMYYVVAPVALAYAAYCWTFIDTPRWRRVAAVVITVNVFFQVSLAVTQFPGASIYMDRALLAQAIRTGQPSLFSHRRPFARDATPDDIAAEADRSQAAADLELTRATMSRPVLDIMSWTLVIHNRSASAAYRDLVCVTTYKNGRGEETNRRVTSIWIVIQPGETKTLEVVDGLRWTEGMVSSEARIVTALPLTPTGP